MPMLDDSLDPFLKKKREALLPFGDGRGFGDGQGGLTGHDPGAGSGDGGGTVFGGSDYPVSVGRCFSTPLPHRGSGAGLGDGPGELDGTGEG